MLGEIKSMESGSESGSENGSGSGRAVIRNGTHSVTIVVWINTKFIDVTKQTRTTFVQVIKP